MGHLRQMIVDRLYPDPWEVRSYALGLHYTDAMTNADKRFYKGLLSSAHHPYAKYGLTLIQDVFRRAIATRFPVGEFRLLLKRDSPEQIERTWVHYDSSAAAYSAIVYMNVPEDCQGGTSFYRHRESGLFHLPEPETPLADRVLAQMGITWEDLIARLSNDGTDVEGQWELVTHAPMAFNRCLIFDARLFHARTGVFGATVATGRLTQNFFFDLD